MENQYQVEKQLIELIGSHVLKNLKHVADFIKDRDYKTAYFVSDCIDTFVFQSELAYGFSLVNVNGFLTKLRSEILFGFKKHHFIDDAALLDCQECILSVQLLINSFLDSLSNPPISETKVVELDLNNEVINCRIESIVTHGSLAIDRRISEFGIDNDYLDGFFINYKDALLLCSYDDFDDQIYEQIIDIALSRLDTKYRVIINDFA